MAKVAVTIRVMPDGPEADLEGIKRGVSQVLGDSLKEVAERPLAFGLVALEAVLILEDAEGQLERSEEAIRGLEGVSSVETLSVDLL